MFKDPTRTAISGSSMVDGSLNFSLPGGFRWFSTADLDAFVEVSHEDASYLKKEIGAIQRRALAFEFDRRERVRVRVREERR